MFQLTKGPDGMVDTAKLRRAVNRTARNYTIHPNDLLSVQVYTNKGEKLVDPNGYLLFGTGGTGMGSGPVAAPASSSGRSGQATAIPNSTQYIVQADGTVYLPLVDRVYVRGLSLIQADSVLRNRYSEYYKEPFIKTSVSNNRVTVLGASGGQVVHLTNDNMNLLEILALAGGSEGTSGTGGSLARNGGRVDNIRIIRGDLKNPQVQIVNLSTLNGMRRADLQIEPNDIIYIQPVRRPFLDALVDAAPALGLASTLLSTVSIVFTIINYSKR